MMNMRRAIQANWISGESFEINDLTDVLDKFKSKPTNTYDFLLKSGGKYKKAIYLSYVKL